MTEWISLSGLNFASWNIPNLQSVDTFNFICDTNSGSGGNYHVLRKYNTMSNAWELFSTKKYPWITTKSTYDGYQIIYSKTNDIIYIHQNNPYIKVQMLIYEYKSNQYSKMITDIDISGEPSLINIDEQLHLIGGTNNKYHLKWNSNTNKFTKIYEFKEWKTGHNCGGLIYVSSKKLLLLGGQSGHDKKIIFNSIWSHYIGSKNWNKLNVTLPVVNKKEHFGYILTSNQKYLIIFCFGMFQHVATLMMLGFSLNECIRSIVATDYNSDMTAQVNWLFTSSSDDCTNDSINVNDIWILNINTMELKKSKIKWPCVQTNTFNVILMPTRLHDELLIRAYIRNISNTAIFSDDLVNLFVKFYTMEYVHLLSGDGKKHWKVLVNDLLV